MYFLSERLTMCHSQHMTAEIVSLFPTGADAEDTIRATVRGLLKGRDLTVETVAPLVGMSPSALYRKLAGHGDKDAFKAGEVASLARVLEVRVDQLYDGLGGTFAPRPPDGGVPIGGERARRYSKPQPSDPKVLPLLLAG